MTDKTLQNNITSIKIRNPSGAEIDITPEHGAYVKNQAYFLADPTSFDGLADIPVADDMFETDNTDFRMQLAKIQFAPREILITGVICTPIKDLQGVAITTDVAYAGRVVLLRQLLHLLATKDNLALVLTTTNPIEDLVWYCHLHSANAVKIKKMAEGYAVAITLAGSDPLLYATPYTVEPSPEAEATLITNDGDVPYYAKITIHGSSSAPIKIYQCIHDENSTQTVTFRNEVQNDVIIDVQYPGQILSIRGTDITNIDTHLGPAFIPIPLGTSLWSASTAGGENLDVTIITRTPYIGVAP